MEIAPGDIRKIHATLIPTAGGPRAAAEPVAIGTAPPGGGAKEQLVAAATTPPGGVRPDDAAAPPSSHAARRPANPANAQSFGDRYSARRRRRSLRRRRRRSASACARRRPATTRAASRLRRRAGAAQDRRGRGRLGRRRRLLDHDQLGSLVRGLDRRQEHDASTRRSSTSRSPAASTSSRSSAPTCRSIRPRASTSCPGRISSSATRWRPRTEQDTARGPASVEIQSQVSGRATPTRRAAPSPDALDAAWRDYYARRARGAARTRTRATFFITI